MYDYEEACPVSRAASVLCERWTLQIIREMLMGATRFSEFRQYLPKMSPTLLNTRLKSLEEAGIIARRKIAEKKGYEYRLMPSGVALEPVVREIGKWGMRWVFENMDAEQLNVAVIVRDFAVALNTRQLPAGDSTLQFNVTGIPEPQKRFVMVQSGGVQVCEDNIGTDVDVYLTASLETFGQIWYGRLGIVPACESGRLKVVGAPHYVDNLSKWLGTSQFAKEGAAANRK